MNLQLTSAQEVLGEVSFLDARGQETDAKSVTFRLSDDEVVNVSYNDIDNIVKLKGLKGGSSTLSIVALTEAGDPIQFEDVQIEITSKEAVTGSISFSEPTEQKRA